eukprot:scaffold10493_cov93-Cylindrotheca_fusiformis.AAC.1
MQFIPIDPEIQSSRSVFEKDPLIQPVSSTCSSSEKDETKPSDTLNSALMLNSSNVEDFWNGPLLNDPSLEPVSVTSAEVVPATATDEDARDLTSLIGNGLQSALASTPDEAISSSPVSPSHEPLPTMTHFDHTPPTTMTTPKKRGPVTIPDDSSPKPKRFKNNLDENDETGSAAFRPHHDRLWNEQFEKLLAYQEKNGHNCVPITYSEDPMLARWVKRQRYQYKRYQEGDTSSAIHPARIKLLESVGFVWDAHAVTWQEKYNELKEYVQRTGNCSIPSYDPQNLKLSTWVKCQRRQYKLYQQGKPSNMTEDRIEKLNDLGFVWSLRKGYKNRK